MGAQFLTIGPPKVGNIVIQAYKNGSMHSQAEKQNGLTSPQYPCVSRIFAKLPLDSKK